MLKNVFFAASLITLFFSVVCNSQPEDSAPQKVEQEVSLGKADSTVSAKQQKAKQDSTSESCSTVVVDPCGSNESEKGFAPSFQLPFGGN